MTLTWHSQLNILILNEKTIISELSNFYSQVYTGVFFLML